MVMVPTVYYDEYGFPLHTSPPPDRAVVLFTDAQRVKWGEVFHDWDRLSPLSSATYPNKSWDFIVVVGEPRLPTQFAYVESLKSRLKPSGKLYFTEP